MIPDGFIACLYGPVPAKTHDARLLCESQLLEQLQTVMPEDGNNPIYALYGDLAYALCAYVLSCSRSVDMNSDEAAYNRLLSSVRITVEWGFAELIEHWKFLDFRSAMKIFQCPVAQYYINAAFLSVQTLKSFAPSCSSVKSFCINPSQAQVTLPNEAFHGASFNK